MPEADASANQSGWAVTREGATAASGGVIASGHVYVRRDRFDPPEPASPDLPAADRPDPLGTAGQVDGPTDGRRTRVVLVIPLQATDATHQWWPMLRVRLVGGATLSISEVRLEPPAVAPSSTATTATTVGG